MFISTSQGAFRTKRAEFHWENAQSSFDYAVVKQTGKVELFSSLPKMAVCGACIAPLGARKEVLALALLLMAIYRVEEKVLILGAQQRLAEVQECTLIQPQEQQVKHSVCPCVLLEGGWIFLFVRTAGNQMKSMTHAHWLLTLETS